jgi:hypothetical protein
VIERVVPEAIDLDSGKLASLPEAVAKKENIAETVLSAGGMDGARRDGCVCRLRARISSASECGPFAQDKSQWEKSPQVQVVALLNASITQPSAYVSLSHWAVRPPTSSRRAKAAKGILQILGLRGRRREEFAISWCRAAAAAACHRRNESAPRCSARDRARSNQSPPQLRLVTGQVTAMLRRRRF